MKITEFSPQEFDKLERPWKILEKGLEMTYFQTYDWYKLVNKHFLMEKKKSAVRFGTYVLATDDNDNPLMIAPIQVNKFTFDVKGLGLKKGFYFIGRQGFSDYLNFIYVDFNGIYLEEILNYLKEKYKLSYCRFENIVDHCSSYDYLNDKFADKGQRIDSVCMSLTFPDTFEEYKKTLSKNMRLNVNKSTNRLIRDNMDFSYKVLDSIDPQMVDELKAIRNQRLGEKETRRVNEMSPLAKMYTFGRKILVGTTSKPIDVMAEIDKCMCLIAECKGEIAAFFYGVYKPEIKTIYMIQAGVDKKYQWYSPGINLMMSFIEDEINNGKPRVAVIDMTRGDEKYKYDIKSSQKLTSQFIFNF